MWRRLIIILSTILLSTILLLGTALLSFSLPGEILRNEIRRNIKIWQLADVVILGSVESISTKEVELPGEGKLPASDVVVNVKWHLKSTQPKTPKIIIRFYGGSLDEEGYLVLSDEAYFWKGEKFIAGLEKTEDGFRVLGGPYGKIDLGD